MLLSRKFPICPVIYFHHCSVPRFIVTFLLLLCILSYFRPQYGRMDLIGPLYEQMDFIVSQGTNQIRHDSSMMWHTNYIEKVPYKQVCPGS